MFVYIVKTSPSSCLLPFFHFELYFIADDENEYKKFEAVGRSHESRHGGAHGGAVLVHMALRCWCTWRCGGSNRAVLLLRKL